MGDGWGLRRPDGGAHGMAHEDAATRALALATALQEADDVNDVLRRAVEAACALTGSRHGLACLWDGEAATSAARYDARHGWEPRRQRWARGEGVPGRVLASGRWLVDDGRARDRGGERHTGLPAARRFACVPLVDGGGELLGCLVVAGRPRPYDAAAQRRLAALAAFAGRRLLAVAAQLQRRLLPGEAPRLPGVEVAFRYRSASPGVLSGGDFVDYYTRPPSTSLAFAIGDVAGKGVEAMATTFVTKYLLRAAVLGGQLAWPVDPGAALQELRTALLEQPDFGYHSERFVTVLVGLLSPRRGVLQLASAGHPAPFVVRRDRVERPLLLTEPAIGIELEAALAPYPVETLSLARGDLVLLFTDGLAELRDTQGRFFEEALPGVLDACRGASAAATVDAVLAAAAGHAARPPADDLAVLCLRLTAGPVE